MLPSKIIQFQAVAGENNNITLFALDESGQLWFSIGYHGGPSWNKVSGKPKQDI